MNCYNRHLVIHLDSPLAKRTQFCLGPGLHGLGRSFIVQAAANTRSQRQLSLYRQDSRRPRLSYLCYSLLLFML